ncbi:MAG: DEAD/DEAH box helicase family protein [Patescibacteria group bacterium]
MRLSGTVDVDPSGLRLTYMIIDSMIRFPDTEWHSFPEVVREHIKRLLTYKNPKYYSAQAMGFSVRALPKTVQTFKQDLLTGDIVISRGEFKSVTDAFQDYPRPIELSLHDKTEMVDLPSIEYVNTEFELDERQNRCIDACMKVRQGIVYAATSSGKSEMIFSLIAQKKQKTLVVINRKVLLDQLMQDAKKRLKGCTFGSVVGGKAEWGDVTFALEKSLMKHIKHVRGRFGMVIGDEVHISAAPSFQKIYDKVGASNRFGFTGTLRRKDHMEFLIYATFGRVVAEVTSNEIIEANRAVPVETIIHETNVSVPDEIWKSKVATDPIRFNKYADALVHENFGRLLQVKDVIMKIREANPDAKIAIACRYLQPLHNLQAELLLDGIEAESITGASKDAIGTCERMEKGECKVILATIPCFSTGINIKSLTDLILISPTFTNELVIHQLRGRLMRMDGTKTYGKLHFMWDPNVYDHRKLSRFLSIMKKS